MKSKEEILQAATEAGAVFGVEEKFFTLYSVDVFFFLGFGLAYAIYH